MRARAVPRIIFFGAIVTLLTGVIGLIVTLVLNAFVLDEFDAYGEVPVPGSGQLHLPAGEATISFHTAVPGGVNGAFPVPALQLGLTPPEGMPEPVVTENTGATTSVNNDVHIRLWVAQIPEEGVYDVEVRGNVAGYIGPQLAFGRDSSMWWLTWVFGALIAVGVAELIIALMWRLRSSGPAPPPLAPPPPVSGWSGSPPPVSSYQPSDQGVRLEQLKTLAALRDSGALTEAEFEAEKRRILGG